MKKTTPLRERMREDLRLRNCAKNSEKLYPYHIFKFFEYWRRSPEHLGLEEVRKYLLHLPERKVSQSHYKQAVAALRFVYKYTLGQDWVKEKIAYPRREFQGAGGAYDRRSLAGSVESKARAASSNPSDDLWHRAAADGSAAAEGVGH